MLDCFVRLPAISGFLTQKKLWRNVPLYNLRGHSAFLRGIETLRGAIENNIHLGVDRLGSAKVRSILPLVA